LATRRPKTNDRAVWTFYRDWFAEMLREVKPEAAD
jgi:hypothetical protein